MSKPLLLLLLLVGYMQAIHFESLAFYASTIPEFPTIDNNDWEHPDYRSSYAHQRTKEYSTLLHKFAFTHKAVTSSDVIDLITHLNLVQGNYNGIPKIIADKDTQCIVFGDLQGAFHSLMRDIAQLISMGILTEDFKIVPDTYLIFNGNVIGDSPYNMQTLYILLLLMSYNPGKVLYIKGSHEQHWLIDKSQLYQQLITLNFSKKELDQIALFFDKLPTCAYIMHNPQKGILIDGGTSVITPETIKVVASIIPHREHKTMGLRRYIGPPTSWALFSSPTGSNRRLHAFLYDAFAIIHTSPDMINWTITFYHNDARKKKNFSEPSIYNLIIGNLMHGPAIEFFDRSDIERLKKEVVELEAYVQELTELCLLQEKEQAEQTAYQSKQLSAIHDQTIVFGCTLDLVKAVRNQSKSLQEGLLAKVRAINEAGGLQGKQVQIIFLDDAYSPSKARENVRRFIDEFKTDVLLCPIGTLTLEHYLDLVVAEKLLVLFPIAGSLALKEVDFENIIQFRPSYIDELIALTEYVINKHQAKRFLIFCQKDSYGQMHKEAIEKFLQAHNIQQYKEFFYENNELDFTQRLSEIRDFNPDTIVFISTSAAAQSLIRQMGVGYFVGKYLYGTSNHFGEAAFKNFMKVKGLPFLVANVVPNPETSDIELAQQFRNKIKQTNMVLDTISFEGYIMASLTEYIFTHVKGSLSKENIINFVRTIKNIDFKGLKLDFNALSNRLSNKLWISESNDPNWIEVDLQGGSL